MDMTHTSSSITPDHRLEGACRAEPRERNAISPGRRGRPGRLWRDAPPVYRSLVICLVARRHVDSATCAAS